MAIVRASRSEMIVGVTMSFFLAVMLLAFVIILKSTVHGSATDSPSSRQQARPIRITLPR